MLSTVAPWGSLAEIREAAPVDCCMVDGKFDVAPNIGEWASWLVPYMIRAKLRFDMTPSRRRLRGYP